RLTVERLEDRTLPATFNPLAGTADGAAGSLRADIIAANNKCDVTKVFNLENSTHHLTLTNIARQEKLSATGDLDLVNLSASAATKIYIFVGTPPAGMPPSSTVINANQIDRVFQVIGADVTVQFQHLIITGGKAIDDGTAGATPGQTNAQGG